MMDQHTGPHFESFDLMGFYPKVPLVELDISSFFFEGILVKEKEFKESLAGFDFRSFQGKAVAVVCHEDTIVPSWVFMMLSEKLLANAAFFDWKDKFALKVHLWIKNLQEVDFSVFRDKKVVVPGNPQIPEALYMEASKLLLPHVQSLMYGDISLPKVIYKRK